jgi:hypothetical protein
MRLSEAASSLPWKRLFAELAVIVAGVLIALAVDAWWQRQQEHRLAEEYLALLLVDFQDTERQLRGAIEAENDRLQAVNRAIDRALRGPLPHPDSVELPTGYNQFEPLTGTLVALIQGGDLRLLRSDSIRFELIGYSAVIHETEEILRHSEGLIWNSTERVIQARARHSQSAVRGEGSAGRAWGTVDVAGLLNDPEILTALQVQTVASQVRLFNLGRLEEPTARIIRLLQAELE